MKKTVITMGLMVLAGVSQAQSAGAWLIQGGMIGVTPHVKSGSLSAPAPANAQADVGADTQATIQITRMLDEHWAIAVPLGMGFKHKLVGAGSISGTGQIGSVRALPIGAMVQYRLGETQARYRPYGMMGLHYVSFDDAQGSAALNGLNPVNPVNGSTGLKIDSHWGMSTGLGLVTQLDNGWFIDVSWSLMMLKTRATLSTGQSMNTTLNPSIFSLGLGTRF